MQSQDWHGQQHSRQNAFSSLVSCSSCNKKCMHNFDDVHMLMFTYSRQLCWNAYLLEQRHSNLTHSCTFDLWCILRIGIQSNMGTCKSFSISINCFQLNTKCQEMHLVCVSVSLCVCIVQVFWLLIIAATYLHANQNAINKNTWISGQSKENCLPIWMLHWNGYTRVRIHLNCFSSSFNMFHCKVDNLTKLSDKNVNCHAYDALENSVIKYN